MTIRVTPNSSLTQSLAYLQRHTAATFRWQEQLSSGLRINRPSDDPAGVRTLLRTQALIDRFDADLGNVAAVRTTLSHSFTHLQDAGQVFIQAKEVALRAQQATDPLERESLAQEVDGLLDQLLTIANAQHDGEYLFGGTRTDARPFVVSPDGVVTYQGSDARVQTIIGEGLRADRIYTGREVFQQTARETTFFLGSTGSAPGSGTDTARGDAKLTVAHTATTYAAGSGVQPGSGSVAGDTILGALGTHTLTINDTSGTGASGTVSLNGGDPVAFTSGDTNLAVTGPAGEVVYIDTTAITAGFNGTIDIQSDGTLSTDGGASTVAIDFSANQQVVNSTNQSVTHVNTSGIVGTGTERLEYRGTADLFQVLDDLRSTLRNTEKLGPSDWHASIDRRLGDIDRAHDQVLSIVGQQSVTLEQLDTLEQRFRSLRLEGERVASETAATDYSAATLSLQQEQLLLQLTLASSARMFDQSILEFLG